MKTKEEKKAYHAAYYVANREKLLAQNKAYRVANPEKEKARSAAYRSAHPEKSNADPVKILSRQLRKYGLTIGEYDLLLDKQSSVCAICRKVCASGDRFGRLSVDHDHTTGKVRGLLCQACNTMVGGSKDSPAILRWAAEYLEKRSCVEVENLVKE